MDAEFKELNDEFKEKTALVTGATRGIGKDIAVTLASLGTKVFISGRNEDSLNSIASEYVKNGYKLIPIPADLSVEDDILRLANTICNYGGVDFFIHSAGITSNHSFFDVSLEEWDEIMKVNTKSAFILAQKLVPFMAKKKFGRIVFISSVVTKTGGLGSANVAYVASKSALVGLVKSLAKFTAKDGITVNSVSPSFVETEMLYQSGLIKIREKLIDLHPVGRLGTVKDVTNAVLFLLKKESSFITGQDIAVNGGYVMY